MIKLYVTTSLHAGNALIRESMEWADSIGAVFAERQGRTLGQLFNDYAVSAILIYTADGPEIRTPLGRHFFNLSMAELRIQHIRKGAPDHFLESLGTHEPVRFLDCTCGFGTDTIVASFGLAQGSVIHALEISPLMASVTAWGFSHFVHDKDDVTEALRRVRLYCRSYEDYLCDPAAEPYDILYFDPMFSHPVKSSPQFQPVRFLLDHDALSEQCIESALQKARKRIVIKGRSFKSLTKSHPDVKLYGGTYSRVGYAVLECNHG